MTSIYNITPVEGGFRDPSIAWWKDNLFVCTYTKNRKTYLGLLRDTNNDFSTLEYTIVDNSVIDGYDTKILKNKKNTFEITYTVDVDGRRVDNSISKITLMINDNLSFTLSQQIILYCPETKNWTF